MPLPEMRAGKHDSLAYCVAVNFAIKPKTLATRPADTVAVIDCRPGCAHLFVGRSPGQEIRQVSWLRCIFDPGPEELRHDLSEGKRIADTCRPRHPDGRADEAILGASLPVIGTES